MKLSNSRDVIREWPKKEDVIRERIQRILELTHLSLSDDTYRAEKHSTQAYSALQEKFPSICT